MSTRPPRPIRPDEDLPLRLSDGDLVDGKAKAGREHGDPRRDRPGDGRAELQRPRQPPPCGRTKRSSSARTTFPLLANKGKYFILVAATCNYANFDAVNDQSGAEILAAKPDAGAIAGLSATRVVYANQNLVLNATFIADLFETIRSDGRRRSGSATRCSARSRRSPRRTTKNIFSSGDPALVPAFPKRFVVVDSVNGRPADQVVDLLRARTLVGLGAGRAGQRCAGLLRFRAGLGV